MFTAFVGAFERGLVYRMNFFSSLEGKGKFPI
jgi:hypothetical protein